MRPGTGPPTASRAAEGLEVSDVVRHDDAAIAHPRIEDLQVGLSAQDWVGDDRAAVDAAQCQLGGDLRGEHLVKEQQRFLKHRRFIVGRAAHRPSSSCWRSRLARACAASDRARSRKASTSSG